MMRRRTLLATSMSLTAMTMTKGYTNNTISARDQGFYLPEESEPHERTFMQWPVSREVHPDPVFLDMLQDAIAETANTIAEFEPVIMLMDKRFESTARQKLSAGVEIWHIPTDDLWCRDAGPLFVKNAGGDLAISHLNFNGWGNKQTHENDSKIARAVATELGLPFFDNGLVGEAGGLETDGQGTIIAHESSWINPNRNSMPKPQVEELMRQAIGMDHIVWAPGVAGADITDYHIDSLARFTEPGTIIIQLPEEPQPDDPWSLTAFETYDILKAARDHNGEAFKLVTIPEPYDTRVTSADFVASYVNYYVCNGAVIMAQFGDRDADAQAAETIGKLYPDREIIALNVDPIGETGGGIHCATQQQPKV